MIHHRTPILCMLLATTSFAQGVLDLGTCGMVFDKLEVVEKLTDVKGQDLKPERRGCQLVLVRIKGRSASGGSFHFGPEIFSATFAYRGTVLSTPARAHGARGKDDKGNPVEHWFREAVKLSVDPKEEVDFWLAFELPKDLGEFHVRYPVHLATPVKLPGTK